MLTTLAAATVLTLARPKPPPPPPTPFWATNLTLEPAKPIKPASDTPKPELGFMPYHFDPMGTHPNSFEPANCTWGAASMKGNISWSGNANQWDDAARARGITVSDVPIIGAVAQTDRGGYGHVGVVTNLDAEHPGQIYLTEMNWDSNGSVRSSWQPQGQYVYIWI